MLKNSTSSKTPNRIYMTIDIVSMIIPPENESNKEPMVDTKIIRVTRRITIKDTLKNKLLMIKNNSQKKILNKNLTTNGEKIPKNKRV